MPTLDGTNAFLIDVPIVVSSDPVASVSDQQETDIDLRQLRSVVIPSEQLDGSPQQSINARGERALMRAILSDAIHCYQKRFVTKNWRTHQSGNEAVAWFAANDEHWPFSFINICRALALEPDYIRRGLKLWRQRMTTILAAEQQCLSPLLSDPIHSAS